MNDDFEKIIEQKILDIYDEMQKMTDEPKVHGNIFYKNPIMLILPIEHTFDPKDSQVEIIDVNWKNYINSNNKKLVIVESGLRGIAKSKEEAFINEGGEGGYLTYLADSENIECVCYEPKKENMYTKAIEKFGVRKVFYAVMVDSIYQYSNEEQDTTIEGYLNYFIDQFNKLLGEKFTFNDLADIHKEISDTNFDPLDWEYSYNIANPFSDTNPLKELQQYIVALRDTAIIASFIKNYEKGIDQFAIYGRTHCYVFREVLRWSFEEGRHVCLFVK